MTTLDTARRLHALGLSVIPVPRPRPGALPNTPGDGKTPAIKWKEFQTRLPTDDEITAWFRGERMNVAVITGALSGVVVVDADDRAALRWATSNLKYTPWQTQTARGFHLCYRHPGERVPNRAHIQIRDSALKLDVRGDGGYVIAPGSLHASGVEYKFAGDWTAPRERVPFFWLGLLAHKQPPTPTLTTTGRCCPRATTLMTRARAYLASIPPPTIGSGSDAATFTVACKLVRGFALNPSEAEALLWEWAGGRPGWTRAWIAAKVEHAERYGREPVGGLQ